MWSICSCVETLYFYFQCFLVFLWCVSHWKKKSKYKVCIHTWLWGCNYALLVQYSNSGSRAFLLLLLQTNASECPPQLFSSAQKRAKEKELWVRNTLRLLAGKEQMCSQCTSEDEVLCSLLVKWKWSNVKFCLYVCLYVQGHSCCFSLVFRKMASSAGWKLILEWNRGGSAFPSGSVCLT